MRKKINVLRILVIFMLVLLFVQYEFGIATLMANPASLPPLSLSLPAFASALGGVGFIAAFHASLGSFLMLLSLVVLILALRSRKWSVGIFGMLGLISTLFAAGGGLFFVLSGFQNDNASHAMATNFLLAYSFYFLVLYFSKRNEQLL